MGTVFKKTVTRPLPAGAELIERKGQRFAVWKDAKGKKRTAPLTVGADGANRIATEAGTYTAKYRDGSGIVREVATGCRDADAARAVLGDLERRSELVKAGVMTAAEDAVADHQATLLTGHVVAYISHQRAKGLNLVRINNTESRLNRLAAECGFVRLGDLAAEPLERWLLARKAEQMGPGTLNEYRAELVAFANWCIRTQRLTSNPFLTVAKGNVKADCRRKRRALTEAELMRLLTVARLRPLAELGRERKKIDPDELVAMGKTPKRTNWEYLPLTVENIDAATERARDRLKDNPEQIAKLERLGRERELTYRVFLLTGLRLNELRTLTTDNLFLDDRQPCIVLNAANEKNRQGSTLPLRADLAADLRAWLNDRAEPTAESGTLKFRRPTATPKAAAKPLFAIPAALVKILNRDIEAAGIPKRDDRGRTVDVHALRGTFATMLSTSGVAPRTAQAALRHSSIDLTMNVYTDPKLLDVAGALDSLPTLTLDGTIPNRMKATGTFDIQSCAVAPTVALTLGNPSKLVSLPDNSSRVEPTDSTSDTLAISAYAVNEKDSLTTDVTESYQVGVAGFEPTTSASRTQRSSQAEPHPEFFFAFLTLHAAKRR